MWVVNLFIIRPVRKYFCKNLNLAFFRSVQSLDPELAFSDPDDKTHDISCKCNYS
jgi:hypothetical protein